MYHIGLIKGTGSRAVWANGHGKKTLIVQMRRNLDSLSPDLWRYLGIRDVTKAHVRANGAALLEELNRIYGTAFTKIVVD